MAEDAARRIGVGLYVDGYNLYYGRLRGSAFKWLDLVALGDQLVADRDQGERLDVVKLFTAHALANFATHGAASVLAQQDYHRALKVKHGDRFEVIYGKHSYDDDGDLQTEQTGAINVPGCWRGTGPVDSDRKGRLKIGHGRVSMEDAELRYGASLGRERVLESGQYRSR